MKIEVIFCELWSGDQEAIRERVFDVPEFSSAAEIERSLRLQIEALTGESVLQMAWCRSLNLEVEQYRGDRGLEGAHANGLQWAHNAALARGHDALAELLQDEMAHFDREQG